MKTKTLKILGIALTLALVASLFVFAAPVNAMGPKQSCTFGCSGWGGLEDILQGPSGYVGNSNNFFQTYRYTYEAHTGDLIGFLVVDSFIVRHFGNVEKGNGSESNTHFSAIFTGSFMGGESGTARMNWVCMGYPDFSGPAVITGIDGGLAGFHANGVYHRTAPDSVIYFDGVYFWDSGK